MTPETTQRWVQEKTGIKKEFNKKLQDIFVEEDIKALVKDELEKFKNENSNTIFAKEIDFRTEL